MAAISLGFSPGPKLAFSWVRVRSKGQPMSKKTNVVGAMAFGLALALPQVASAVPVEHIVNGGFEAGLLGWSCTGEDLCDTGGTPHSGSAAFRGFDNSGFATLSQTIVTIAGENYD